MFSLWMIYQSNPFANVIEKALTAKLNSEPSPLPGMGVKEKHSIMSLGL